ncbi:AAA family ATPase [Uliginosibacterium sp. H3]|uniref:AAA family ATPase n=1 Tax=Uliginosibacterium silvisoli TaxID=3114758 RepID=A0ABU6K799_9RHOO|nr:AAA family ATPase [Uliginosibacterium sp. H3]
MRLQTLELIRYGKFTEQTLHFPKADCDFHLIVGANEAGKSTLRRAVSELLFGMPLRSEMDFLHPLADLRLGAVIQSDVGGLAFHRSRGRKSLRRPDDEALVDATLVEHLGLTSETMFKRMFCLDLTELLAGGKSILDASDDVGQLLFQSASGLSSLGKVRDALGKEADLLFAPRRSGERAFYQALEQLDTAKHTLRSATVKTSQWTAAMDRVEALQTSQKEASAQYQALSGERQKLERVRRIAPSVAQLRDVQARLEMLAEVVEFPQDAAPRLAEAEEALAVQAVIFNLHRESLASLQTQLAGLLSDEAVLQHAAAAEAFVARSHACVEHRQKIARAEHELQILLRDAASLAVQLGWSTDEVTLRERVPGALALKTLESVLEDRGALLQAQQSALLNHVRAEAALSRLQAQAGAPELASVPLSPALPAALQDAQALQTSHARQRKLSAELAQVEALRESALAALSTWSLTLTSLAALPAPAEEQVSMLKAERAGLINAVETARQQRAQALEQDRQSALALEQFAASHGVVTLDEVQQARTARDAMWGQIKQEEIPLPSGAPKLDQAIAEADRLVDSQRDHAEDSARLLNLRQTQLRDAAAVAAREEQLVEAQQALEAFEARWTQQAQTMGLPGMPLLDLSAWLVRRQAALDAAAAVQAKAAELATEQADEAAAMTTLLLAMQTSGAADLDGESLAALCQRAVALIRTRQAAEVAAGQRATQLAEAQTELTHQALAVRASETALGQWQARWDGAVKAAALAGDWLTPDSARHAIEVVEQVLGLMAQADDLRQRQIEVMQNELAEFEAAAEVLEHALGRSDADAFAWAQALTQRLQAARELQQARSRLSGEILNSETQVRAAEAALATTRAALQSLYSLAESEDHAMLRTRIADSDRRRALDTELQQYRQAILNAGDGLSLDDLLISCDSVASETLKPRLEEMDGQLSALVERQTRLATELAQAQAELDKAQGGADAAQAESKRLESLAQLGDAAERYMTVATAHRLLRWAIDRYRERKQGPLLQQASELFSRLTLGGFARLSPDFEVTPPRLIAVRASGERVGIDGLSEGTRDQLFLALRLAALEMQIENDRPLPFIADDLFVNFHDSRSRAGLAALGQLARKTQVIFLTHHDHLVDVARECVGSEINVIHLG